MLSVFLLLLAGAGFFIGAKIINSSASVFKSSSSNSGQAALNIVSQLKNINSKEAPEPIKGQESGRTNILLLGKGGKGHPGGELTDAIMILSVKYNGTNTPEAALVSIPRDLYVPIPDTPYYTRINAIKSYGSAYLGPKKIARNYSVEEAQKFEYEKEKAGMDLLKKTMGETFGVPIHYYIELDFEGFTDVIDILGGVNFTLNEDMYDPLYPGPNYTYDPFYLKKGEYLLDGKTVLKLMRTRHAPQGDFTRIARQQKLLSLIKEKAISGNPLRDFFLFSKVSESLAEHMFTDMEISDFKSFWEIGKNIDPEKALYTTIDKENGYLKGEIINGAQMLVPKSGNYENIKNALVYLFDPEKQKNLSEKIKNDIPLAADKEKILDIPTEKPMISLILRRQSNFYSEKIISSLKEKGFKIVKISEPDNDLSVVQNILFDNTLKKKPLSLKYLEQTFGVKGIMPQMAAASGPDFTLIVNN